MRRRGESGRRIGRVALDHEKVEDDIKPLTSFGITEPRRAAVAFERLGVTPIGVVIAINIAMFSAISGRMISSQALSSAIPAPPDRGAYMSISSSLQQLAGGVASSCAGLLVSQVEGGALEHYERLGYVAASSMAVVLDDGLRTSTQIVRRPLW